MVPERYLTRRRGSNNRWSTRYCANELHLLPDFGLTPMQGQPEESGGSGGGGEGPRSIPILETTDYIKIHYNHRYRITRISVRRTRMPQHLMALPTQPSLVLPLMHNIVFFMSTFWAPSYSEIMRNFLSRAALSGHYFFHDSIPLPRLCLTQSPRPPANKASSKSVSTAIS